VEVGCLLKVTLTNPVLNDGELESLKADAKLKAYQLPIFFDVTKGVEGSLQRALERLCEAADDAVRSGSQLLILSDRLDELVNNLAWLHDICCLHACKL
jgi:glutamate synthase (ferredoxin)